MARPGPTRRHRVKTCLVNNLLTMLTVAGVLGGCFLGVILRSTREGGQWSQREAMYVSFPGDIFLRMLKCLIVPLLVSSIVSAIGSLDLTLSKKIAFRAISYYITTTICAVTLGIILVVTVRPGHGASANFDNTDRKQVTRNVTTVDTLLDLIRNLFPPNLVQATIAQYKTVLVKPENATNQTSLYEYNIKGEYGDTTNVLGLVVFSAVFGITLGKMGHAGKPLLDFFNTLSETMMIVTNWVIWVSPIGVFFLVAAKILEIKSFEELIGKLSLYFMTVLLGLFIHGFGTLSVIYFMCTRRLPFRFIGGLSQVLATAFGTSSSSATMPLTIQCMDKMGIDPRISRFVIPIGATINMDGTALYEAVAAIFIAQIRNVDLSFGKIVAVCVTATAASIGAAGIPQAGLVTMVMVLDTVGLPAEDVSLIIAVDWLLDRFRTTINVMCDAMGASIVDHLSKGDIKAAADLELDRTNAEPHELVEIVKSDDSRL